MPDEKKAAHKKWLTLIELLVAVAIVGILGALLYQSFLKGSLNHV